MERKMNLNPWKRVMALNITRKMFGPRVAAEFAVGVGGELVDPGPSSLSGGPNVIVHSPPLT